MMENFFEFNKDGLETEETDILLVMKSGYVSLNQQFYRGKYREFKEI